jgi:hypothetical protein
MGQTLKPALNRAFSASFSGDNEMFRYGENKSHSA